MLAASSRLRIAAALVASAWATLVAVNGSAQTIDFSLNVFYANQNDPNSGGTWELVAKSTTPGPPDFGIAGLTLNLRNISDDALLEGPRGTVNGSTAAGFQILSNTPHSAVPPTPAYREIVVSQLPLIPLPSGSEENLFYGVGTLTNGAPNYPGKGTATSIGPAFTSLTSPQDIPWAEVPDVFGDAAWNTAARMLSGTFGFGVTPGFFSGTQGDIFTTLPTTNTLPIGNIVTAATGLTVVRTNLVPSSADYNHDNIVDALDYVLWRKTQGSTAAPPGSGADGNHDGTVNAADYTLWAAHFGNPSGSGAGGGLSTSTVPEPMSGALLTIGALLILAPRRGRFQHPVNN